MNNKNTDIAIVGMSCYYPDADNIQKYWHNLVNGVDSIIEAPADRIDPMYFQKEEGAIDRFYCNKGAFGTVFPIDPTKYGIVPVAAEGYDPEHLLVLKIAHEALEDAGIFEKKIPLNSCSFILGKGNFTGLSMLRVIDIVHTGAQMVEVIKTALPDLSDEEVDKIKKEYQKTKGRYQADTAIGTMPNLVASLVANKLDMQGPAYTIDGACASSLIAVQHSIQNLLSGQCDIALAGGIHAGQTAIFWSLFNMLGAVSKKGQISPLSEDADGLLIGEGGGIIVLKKLEKAIADKDRIYAVIKGIGICSDGSGVSVMAPNTKGQKKAIDLAWENANMDRNKLGYIEAHGTATVVGDKTEIATLTEAFGDKTNPEVLIGSVKSNIGHTMPAAGMASIIKTALSLYHRQIPPTLHCEKPAKAVLDSRFRPVQELTPWDEKERPLIAAVNAFGFGGINGHVILEAHESTPGKKTTSDILKQMERVAVLSASGKDELIKKLDEEDFTVDASGTYRLVLFNPTRDRIEKAKSIISKDKPWKGRLDIWFSNAPLLERGGKLGFLFAGYDISTPEVETLSEYFNIPQKTFDSGDNTMLQHALSLYWASKTIDESLKKIGVKPDMNAGHSIGEWHAISASGLSTDESVEHFLKSVETSQDVMRGMYFVAVGCGYHKIEAKIKGIENLYLANDNCPNQILMCGDSESSQLLIDILKKEKIYYQKLEYESGFHTPFLNYGVLGVDEAMKQLELRQNDIPLWSATTLEQYPTDEEKFRELTVQHLTTTVRFRELITKLYNEEGVRVFIQVGHGSLTGFVDDILKGQNYSVIPTSIMNRSGIDQLRRVLALLFVEGKNIKTSLLKQKESKNNGRREVVLKTFLPIVKDLPLLKKAVINRRSSFLPDDILPDNPSDPVLVALKDNLHELYSIQNEMVKLYEERKPVQRQQRLAVQRPQIQRPQVQIPVVEKTVAFDEETLVVRLEDHPYLSDHTIVKQPVGWKFSEDLNPVIPMTMTIELLAEVANKRYPSKKVVSLEYFRVMQWMGVAKEFKETIKIEKKGEGILSLNMKNYAASDVILEDTLPVYAEEPVDLGAKVLDEIPTKMDLYNSFMFHGPSYQGLSEITEVRERGLRARVRKAPGKGSLLDTLGQLIGLYLHLTKASDHVSFPVSLRKITFYQDFLDQEGVFDFTLHVTEMTENVIAGDMTLSRDGKVWCVAQNWKNRRFEIDAELWNGIRAPHVNLVAKTVKDNVFYFDNAYSQAGSWGFLLKRYLNTPEREYYDSLMLNKGKEFLISRIALKDAVRSRVTNENGEYRYPIEVFVNHHSSGKPYVTGFEGLDKLEVSLAHKGVNSVAIASDKPVGIDIETIEQRSDEFIDISFTKHEKELLKGRDMAEWTTRLWVAKEAYGKMLGTGLNGNPKQIEIERIEGETLFIKDVSVETIKYKDKFIIGWTL